MLPDLRGKMFDPFQTVKELRELGERLFLGWGGVAQNMLSEKEKEKLPLRQDETGGNGPPITEELS